MIDGELWKGKTVHDDSLFLLPVDGAPLKRIWGNEERDQVQGEFHYGYIHLEESVGSLQGYSQETVDYIELALNKKS